MSEKIGIYVCECGPNIADRVDIDRILEKISGLKEYKDVELVVKKHKLLCSVAGKAFLEEEIRNNELTHLVCAACSPRDHDTTFMEICKKADLNPYMYKLVNIREQCAWVIPDKKAATDKAIEYIRAGIDRVLYQEPLFEKHLDSNPDVLVIGGGITGLEAALQLAGSKRRVFLVEKEEELGGKARFFKELLPKQGGMNNPILKKIDQVKKNPNIKVFTGTELKRIVGFLGNYEIVLQQADENEIELLAGAVVLANGFKYKEAKNYRGYNYNDQDEVYSAFEIEKMYAQKGKITLRNGDIPQKVSLVHCVGRKEVGYCSKICCNYLYKIARYLQKQSSKIEIFDLHQDICLPDKEDEEFYKAVKAVGLKSIRFEKVGFEGNRLRIITKDGKEEELEADMIIYAPAMLPGEDNQYFSELLNLDLHETGFFQEVHIKVNPVSTSTDGVFIAGASRGPAGISDSLMQAEAASGMILTQLIPGKKIIPEVMVSEIMEAYCTGCKNCLDVCVYGAIYFDDERGISVVNEAICRGCGNCVGSCPSGAIRTRHFTNPQLYQEVKEALRKC